MKKIRSKNIFDQPKNSTKHFFDKSFRIFFDENFSINCFSDHLFRSQMIQRFRKSHLEQRATIIKIRTRRTEKKLSFFPQYCHPGGYQFRGSSVKYLQLMRAKTSHVRRKPTRLPDLTIAMELFVTFGTI